METSRKVINEPDEPYTYFQPGELLFLLTYGGDQRIGNFDRVMESWVPCVEAVIKSKEFFSKLTVHRCKDHEIHFKGIPSWQESLARKPEGPESMYESPRWEKHNAFSLVSLELRLPTGDKLADNSQLIEVMLHLNLEANKTILQADLTKAKPSGEIWIDTILLNWLASPASEYGGGGGPGGRPEPYQETFGQGIIGKIPYEFEIPSAKPFLKPTGGEGVTIAILDTAPNPHDMAAAYERYYKLNPLNRTESHPLIESLFRPQGRFHVHPASLDELLRMRAVHLRDHNYEMSDHGLFIAGMIHTIAPEAEIHLYEVLNPYGVGDLASITKGLREVLDQFAEKHLVVNCSFMLNIPLFDQPTTNLDPNLRAIEGRLTNISQRGQTWLASQTKVLRWICDEFLSQGSRVIAAAGNDWRPNENKDRPQARFPAAFESVLGVGAFPKDAQPDPNNNKYSPAGYSNLSDAPEKYGVITLGGEAGAEKGILGIYLGKFPPVKFLLPKYLKPFLALISIVWTEGISGPENKNNWAWWSGTSFATPIVTALTAVALSDLGGTATAEDAIRKLYRSQVIQPSLTMNDEAGIADVRQV